MHLNILVSACLLGVPCRYNGRGAAAPALLDLVRRHRLVPVCPEQLGGLPTPRMPAERVGDAVISSDGSDLTVHYTRGAAVSCEMARLFACTHAILKSRSPSCGCGCIYDGAFSGKLIPGYGVTAELLLRAGLRVADEQAFWEWGL